MEESNDINAGKARVTIYIPQDLFATLTEAAAGRRRGGQGGMTGLVEAALRQYFDQPRPEPEPAPEEQTWITMLHEILESGHVRAIDATTKILEIIPLTQKR